MIRIQWFRTLRGAAYLLAAALWVAGMSRPAAAQEVTDDEATEWDGCDVEGISDMIISEDGSEVDTYSETFISFDLDWNWYGAYVEAYLYDDGQLIDADAEWDDGTGDAEAYLSDNAEAGHTYELDSAHYLYDEGDCDPDFPDECDVYEVLDTSVSEEDSGAPYIYSISPTSAAVGTSGSISVNGDNLVDPSECADSVSFTGTGVQFNIVNTRINGSCQQEADALTINYTIEQSASTGNQTLKLSTDLGTSNGVTFTVYDPTPYISSITPSSWDAGTSPTVIISGSGFGTNPQVTSNDPNVVPQVLGSWDNLVSAQIICQMVTSQSAGGQYYITVTSGGYGNGLLAAPGGGLTATATVSVTAQQQQQQGLPAAQINYFGTPITGTKSVYVGQLISLTVSGLPQGATITSNTWGIDGTVIAGYSANTTAGTRTPLSVLTNPAVTFYWLSPSSPGNYIVTYCYAVNGGPLCSSPQSKATFSVVEPTGVNVTATPNTVVIVQATLQTFPVLDNVGQGPGGGQGMTFLASATLPANNQGQLQWVQLINSDVSQNLVSPSGTNVTPVSSGLDVAAACPNCYYPYGVKADPTKPIDSCFDNPATVYTTNQNLPCDTAVDSPASNLVIHFGELQRSFNATMYLEWVPLADNTCTINNPGNNPPCTIPAPLGSINWKWSGDAIDTLKPNPGTGYEYWVMNPDCSGGAPRSVAQPFSPGGSLPQWTKNSQQ